MMSYLWGGMILLGVIYGAFAGNLSAVTAAVVNSAKEAVNLVIAILGITAFWTGIMKIAEKAGLVEKLAEKTGPLLAFLFPELKMKKKPKCYISLNFLSNFLGLSHARYQLRASCFSRSWTGSTDTVRLPVRQCVPF